jgi:hypothetical protein
MPTNPLISPKLGSPSEIITRKRRRRSRRRTQEKKMT